ncbi:MAG: DUF2397 family protein [Clostridiales bacterium]|nr:DUF2397 family protein [Clostridiales bacterium]
MVLSWITKANASQSKTARTEYSMRYRLNPSDRTCVLHCTDGDLTLPDYCLDFEIVKPHG